jgi:hypothetical protein
LKEIGAQSWIETKFEFEFARSYLVTMRSKVISVRKSGHIRQNLHYIVRPAKSPRVGWDKAFKKMRLQLDDPLIDPLLSPGEWDRTEWTW